MEFKLIDEYDFVHLFTEVNYGMVLWNSTQYADFRDTTTSNKLTINVGVRFGAFR